MSFATGAPGDDLAEEIAQARHDVDAARYWAEQGQGGGDAVSVAQYRLSALLRRQEQDEAAGNTARDIGSGRKFTHPTPEPSGENAARVGGGVK